ncbi:MAG: hypothetical protein PF961_15325, partial [Planctomycetota bacterium]|nr:hypothetical protein [Planctomycetota bacterium]
MLRILVLIALCVSLPAMDAVISAAEDLNTKLSSGAVTWDGWALYVRHDTQVQGDTLTIIQPLHGDALALWGSQDVHQSGTWLILADQAGLRQRGAMAVSSIALEPYTDGNRLRETLRRSDLGARAFRSRITATWLGANGLRIDADWRRGGERAANPTLVIGEWALYVDGERSQVEQIVSLLGGDAVQALFDRDLQILEHRLQTILIAMIAYGMDNDQRFPALDLPQHPFPVDDPKRGALITAASLEHLVTETDHELPWELFTSPFMTAP